MSWLFDLVTFGLYFIGYSMAIVLLIFILVKTGTFAFYQGRQKHFDLREKKNGES